MMLRSLGPMIIFGLALLAPGHGLCTDRADLDAAFLATFGQRAPLARTVQRPIYNDATPPKLVETRSIVFDVRPEQLFSLGGDHYALVSYEVYRNPGHVNTGEIAVSYLTRAAHWTLTQSWPEFLSSGVGGEPANAGREVHRFGGNLLFVARTGWCGMGECSESLGVIRFKPSRPVAYDDVLAGATSPTDDDVHNYEGNTCRNYDVRARIEPPRQRGSLFSVRYDGWTSPPGKLSPKTPLHLFTSYVPHGESLVMQPAIPVPTCGR